jgi:hypothetical protein
VDFTALADFIGVSIRTILIWHHQEPTAAQRSG